MGPSKKGILKWPVQCILVYMNILDRSSSFGGMGDGGLIYTDPRICPWKVAFAVLYHISFI